MLVTLEVPYADTTAADLGLVLGLPEQPALHVLDLTDVGQPGVHLHLRLLGASHQVVLRTPDVDVTETVACLPGRPAELPSTRDDPRAGYRFAAHVRRYRRAELSAQVGELCRELSADPYALVGVFPGSPDAVTALSARIDVARSDVARSDVARIDVARIDGYEIGWRTWHAYPQTGELVETETTVRVR